MDLSFLDAVGGPRTVVAVAVGLALLYVLKRLFAKKPGSAHLTTTRCPGCGWVGQVSKHRPVCPRCAAKL